MPVDKRICYVLVTADKLIIATKNRTLVGVDVGDYLVPGNAAPTLDLSPTPYALIRESSYGVEGSGSKIVAKYPS